MAVIILNIFYTCSQRQFLNMKNTIKLFISTSILLIAFTPMNSIAKSIAKSTDRHSIGGVYIGDTESQVYRRLGKPIHYDLNRGGCGTDFTKVLVFSSGKVHLGKAGNEPFIVESIDTQNYNWKTEVGIKVGDHISKAKQFYKLRKYDHNSNTLVASVPKESLSLTFKTNKANEIIDIILLAYYC
jgi:hypothetical protein